MDYDTLIKLHPEAFSAPQQAIKRINAKSNRSTGAILEKIITRIDRRLAGIENRLDEIEKGV